MSQIDIEQWMHASDEERASMHAAWDVNNDEGKEIVESVANLLKKECVYDVEEVKPLNANGTWQILAYAGADYESLKDRDIEFLGFKLQFKKID